jgi:hypothetical protein
MQFPFFICSSNSDDDDVFFAVKPFHCCMCAKIQKVDEMKADKQLHTLISYNILLLSFFAFTAFLHTTKIVIRYDVFMMNTHH